MMFHFWIEFDLLARILFNVPYYGFQIFHKYPCIWTSFVDPLTTQSDKLNPWTNVTHVSKYLKKRSFQNIAFCNIQYFEDQKYYRIHK